MIDSPKALVVGASSGIGAAISRALAGRGMDVALVARREAELRSVATKIDDVAGRPLARVYVADVLDYDAAPGLLDRIATDMGGLDIVVYAAGVMPQVGASEYAFEKDRRTIEVNVLGAMAWLDPAAERFERQRGGTIVGISSVAADRGRRTMPAYSASKAAFDTYLEALRNRLARFGVHVLTVRPGPVKTDMIAGAKLPPFPKPISAELAARLIVAALDDKADVRYVPWFYGGIGWVLRHLPGRLMKKVNL